MLRVYNDTARFVTQGGGKRKADGAARSGESSVQGAHRKSPDQCQRSINGKRYRSSARGFVAEDFVAG